MRNWSWQRAVNGGDTPVCCSTGSQWLGVPSKNGGGEWNWDVSFLDFFLFWYFFCFCSPREDFSESSPASHSLSGSTSILSRFGSINARVCTRVYCMSSMHPLSLWYCPFSISPSLCPLAAKLLCSTQLYHFCRVEWKKGKAGIL